MNLFAYGSLMHPDIMGHVCEAAFEHEGGVLEGYLRRTLKGEVYPAMVPQAGASVEGVVYFDVTEDAWDRLDRFETKQYVREAVRVRLASGREVVAEAYVLAPEERHLLGEGAWSYEEFLRTGEAAFWAGYRGFGALE